VEVAMNRTVCIARGDQRGLGQDQNSRERELEATTHENTQRKRIEFPKWTQKRIIAKTPLPARDTNDNLEGLAFQNDVCAVQRGMKIAGRPT
jgi:hypothetical protein